MEQNRMDLPNSTLVLVLGILSLIFCWCYGFVGLILGIIAVALSGSPRRMYRENPENYFEPSYKNLNAGRVCGIIGICISALIIVFVILIVLGIVAAGMSALPYNIQI